MRILQVSSARTFGGGERHFVDLSRALAARGNTVFAALRPTSEWQGRLDFLPPANILQVSIRNSFGVLSAKRIADFIRENEIDVIHAHVARDYIPAGLAAHLSGTAAFVLTRHLVFPLKAFNRIALKNVDRAIAVSDGAAHSLRKTFDHKKITIIPNGINISLWPAAEPELKRQDFRASHNIPPDAPLIGIIGELIPLKGQTEFILAAAEVAKAIPAARFVIVGKDNTVDKKFRRELKRLASVLGLEQNILWLDWVEETSELLAALDLLVSASHSESFGLAMLEAIVSGTPVAATATEGARELLGTDAECAATGNAAELASLIVKKLTETDETRRFADIVQQRARERFSIEKMADETENVYRSVVEEKKAGRK